MCEKITAFENGDSYHLLVCEVDNKIVASVMLVIIENLNHNLQPFSVLQNVVTHKEHRGKHYATALIDEARAIANKFNCDRMMLMTGSKLESTLKFYENCGFNKDEKIGFLHRL